MYVYYICAFRLGLTEVYCFWKFNRGVWVASAWSGFSAWQSAWCQIRNRHAAQRKRAEPACGRGARAASWKHGRAPSVPFAQHGMRSNEIELGTRAS
mmetsp:Transcript_33695/g.72720  ORF Transcript_33695/g.72720 Transcript_33695/m.72720 type:complete len:97 (-) Transcript_33695:9-299(-)